MDRLEKIEKSETVRELTTEEIARRTRGAWVYCRLGELMYAHLDVEDALDRVHQDVPGAEELLARAAGRLGALIEAMRADMGLPEAAR